MATEILRPTADGTYQEIDGGTQAHPNHWQEVDEEAADGDTTTVSDNNNTTFETDTYGLENHSVGSGTINSVTVYAVAKYGSGTLAQTSLKIACYTTGALHEGAETNITTDFVEYSKEWTTNPETTNLWTWGEIDALEVGVSVRAAHGTAGKATYCTQVYVVVDYTAGETEAYGYVV